MCLEEGTHGAGGVLLFAPRGAAVQCDGQQLRESFPGLDLGHGRVLPQR